MQQKTIKRKPHANRNACNVRLRGGINRMTQMVVKSQEHEAKEQVAERIGFWHSPKRVRVYFGGEFIADSKKTVLVREKGHFLTYYFPRQDVRMDLLEKSQHQRELAGLGQAAYWTVEAGGQEAKNAAWSLEKADTGASEIEGYVAFKWNQMDAWFEEDEQVFVHPRDPFVRIDTVRSSRHVRVAIDGETVAETNRPMLLFETGLPVRYYIPKVDVRMDLLQPSTTHSECPYKGVASYYSIKVGDHVSEDIVWYYPFPLLEVSKIQNMLSFYNEKVDLYVDGVLEEKPKTYWS
jgi:uncharacterized protein (DUF427 family)